MPKYGDDRHQRHLGTQCPCYRCSLPGLAGFTVNRREGTDASHHKLIASGLGLIFRMRNSTGCTRKMKDAFRVFLVLFNISHHNTRFVFQSLNNIMGKPKKSKTPDNTIARNKSARFEFFIEETHEVGIELQGWEVKSLREKKLQLNESYVFIKNNELWLSGAHIAPLTSASTHVKPEPTRIRKLLAHRHEIDRMEGQVERKGYTLIALSAYWSKGKAKLSIGVAKGKKLHDKRATQKERDWSRDKARMMKHH